MLSGWEGNRRSGV